MKLKDYIIINQFDSGDTKYYFNILDYFNVDYKDLTMVDVYHKVAELTDIKTYELKTDEIKINGKKFKIEKDITRSTAIQFILLDSYLTGEDYFINHLNEVLSIYVRPRIWSWKKLKWIIEPFDTGKKEINDKLLLEMDCDDAFSLNVFFYQGAKNSIRNMKIRYLEMMKKMINQTMN